MKRPSKTFSNSLAKERAALLFAFSLSFCAFYFLCKGELRWVSLKKNLEKLAEEVGECRDKNAAEQEVDGKMVCLKGKISTPQEVFDEFVHPQNKLILLVRKKTRDYSNKEAFQTYKPLELLLEKVHVEDLFPVLIKHQDRVPLNLTPEMLETPIDWKVGTNKPNQIHSSSSQDVYTYWGIEEGDFTVIGRKSGDKLVALSGSFFQEFLVYKGLWTFSAMKEDLEKTWKIYLYLMRFLAFCLFWVSLAFYFSKLSALKTEFTGLYQRFPRILPLSITFLWVLLSSLVLFYYPTIPTGFLLAMIWTFFWGNLFRQQLLS